MRCANPEHLLTPLRGALKQLWHFCQPSWVSESFGQDRWHTGHSTLEASSTFHFEAYLHINLFIKSRKEDMCSMRVMT